MADHDHALLSVGIAAALADGTCDPAERAQLELLAGQLAAGFDPTAAMLPTDLADRLGTPAAREAAFELAVSVCHADGVVNDAERSFLVNLRSLLGLAPATAMPAEAEARALADAAVAGGAVTTATATTADELILQHAVLAGALELLPQRLATMAVIPLQLRLVYLIGQRHGQSLDAAQAKDLVATLGLGAATQVIDGMARRLLGSVARGILGRVLGGITGGVAGMAAGAGTVFAATYALGHAAEQYYGQGRSLSSADLQALFARLRDEAMAQYPTLQARIQEQARTLDLQQVVASLTGQGPPAAG